MKSHREMCLEAGMDDYVSKPIRANQLFGKLQEVWANFRKE
jgi:CheY-like chemotaxis protein